MIIAVCNQKGGVGKTATVQAIATGAARKGRSSLAIDLDPQGNLTFAMGGNGADNGSFELMAGKATIGQCIQHTSQGDIIPSSIALALADTAFTGPNRATALRDAIRPVKGRYDAIVIDCPPSLNLLLVNALMASDKVIIPLTADMFALQGLYQLKQSIDSARKANKALSIGGVVFTKHNTRTILARDLTEVIKAKCKELEIPVYQTCIREGIAVREAQTQRRSLIDYAPNSKPATDYMQLVGEIFQ